VSSYFYGPRGGCGGSPQLKTDDRSCSGLS
jgi:hypothetical protein